MNHVFHPQAALEYEEAVEFYNSRGARLGERFSAEVRATIRKILDHPERWGVLEGEVRRCFVRIFPYRVLYTIEKDFILVIAVVHHSRAPGYWRHRVPFPPSL